jgi:Tol biopolymer transport system component
MGTMRVAAAALAVALTVSAAFAAAASAFPASFAGTSHDGEIVFFTTAEQLVPGDTDNKQDVYERAYDAGVGEYVTREVSTGPTGGNDAYEAVFHGASSDGELVFFSTVERLVAADADGVRDIYVRNLATGSTELVSAGASSCAPGCGNGDQDVGFSGATSDASKVFFVTAEALAAGDTDSAEDLYERDLDAGTTTLVSAGAFSCAPLCGNGGGDVTYRGVSEDGTEVYFNTTEQLAAGDTDIAQDIYARNLASGATVLVSAGSSACQPGCGNGEEVPIFQRSSSDGSRVFFTTEESLAGADTDIATDVYARDLPAGPTTLVSAGTDANRTATFAAASADGSKVFFVTTEGLDGADGNGANDVYRWSGGAPELVTSGTCAQGSGCGSSFNAATSDGNSLIFTTTEQLSPADSDSSADVYSAAAPSWMPALISEGEPACAPACGNGPSAAIFNASAADGSKTVFTTAESLAPADTDSAADIYLRDAAAQTTTLLSPSGVCPLKDPCGAVYTGASADRSHVFFQTGERLTAEDVDSESDVYERSAGQTRIVSVGNATTVGPATPVLTGTDPASPAETTTPRIKGHAESGASIKLYAQGSCAGIPVATGTALELEGAGIQVTVAPASTTTFFATASDAEGDTSPCSPGVTYTQAVVEVQPPPPPAEGGGGGETAPGGDEGSSGGGGSKHGGGSGSNKGGGAGGGGIAYVIPRGLITFGPGHKTRIRRPVFRFTDATDQPGTDFFCRVDRRHWRACSSPIKLKRLHLGRHVFKVKARNAVGVWCERVAKRRFKVVR